MIPLPILVPCLLGLAILAAIAYALASAITWWGVAALVAVFALWCVWALRSEDMRQERER